MLSARDASCLAAHLFQEAEADGSQAAALWSENAELHASVERLGAALHHAEVRA